MLADYRTAPIAEPLRAALALLERVSRSPGEVTAGEVRALRAKGLTREMAESALWVGYCFEQISRLADALGWEVLDPQGFAATASALLQRGYLMPFRTKPER